MRELLVEALQHTGKSFEAHRTRGLQTGTHCTGRFELYLPSVNASVHGHQHFYKVPSGNMLVDT